MEESYCVSMKAAAEYFDAHPEKQIDIKDQEPEEGRQILFLANGMGTKAQPKKNHYVISCASYGYPFATKDIVHLWMYVEHHII